MLKLAPVAADTPLRPYAVVLAAADLAACWGIVVMISVMVAVVSSQVFMRYVLNSSIGWADEVSRLTFVWSIFLAIPLGIRAGAHIGMEILTARLPGPVQGGLARLMAALSAALMILVAYESAVITWDQWDEKMASLDASAAIFVLALAVGCTHAALHLIFIVLTGKPRPAAVVSAE